MLIALFAVALLSQSPQATPETSPPATQEATVVAPVNVSGSRIITARAPTLPDGPTRVVCSRERTLDSNIQRRVCRRVAVNSSERERMASDMMQDMQRLSFGIPTARQPGGRPVN